MLGTLAAISLLIEPIRTEQPAAARQGAAMRRSQGVDGTGVGIGVLSSGVATLITGEAAADLPDRVTVLPGQAGEGDDGTATLSILRELAPGGELYFATGLGGPARFAANLAALCRAGADVIVDDLFDHQETIHQGGLMAQAVQAAVRNGCVYVSAQGNPVHSRVREGEFAPDPAPPIPDDLSTNGDSAGATCVTAANPDFATFCVSSAPPPQVAALVALTLEAAGGAHNTSLEELRAAVTGGGLEPEPIPVNVAAGPAVREVEINSNPPEGRDPGGNESIAFTDQAVTNQAGGRLPASAVRQIQSLLSAKVRRTPAQRKVSSQLLEERRNPRRKPKAAGIGRLQATDPEAKEERVMVDIRADVTPAVLDRIRDLGGEVINSVPKYRAIRARLPLAAVETLAELDAVRTIRPAEEPIVGGGTKRNSSSVRTRLNDIPVFRKDDTSEGDVAHRADVARSTYDVDGTGIGVGVISDGVDTLADQQATGDVPARVTVLPGQEGGSFPLTCGDRTSGTEGTALLEIVHDLAPGAELFFADGGAGPAQMAQNIEDLCESGADIIVDDIGYTGLSPFQDDIIAQAVSTAAANGCHYFSSTGNGGNKNDGTASVWEGDFAAGPALNLSGVGAGDVVHDFGGGVTGNEITKDSTRSIVLQWSDPVGGSANDYDLFLIDAENNVLASSTATQDGAQDPIEFILSSCSPDRRGTRLVIVKNAGAEDRYLRITYTRGGLAFTTAGRTFGHSAAQDAIGVAAVDVGDAGGADGVFDGTESVETFSSDGPRRIFFEADGTPITPGNFSSTGGRVLQKPDLTAADGVSTSTPGFSTFFGTSAAAPHAAAIGALMLEAAGGSANVTQDDLRTAMTGSALDIEATGVDRDSGAGIVMAPGAVDAVDVAVADRNRAPTVENSVADRTFAPGAAAVTIDLANVFGDPDDDTLTYMAWSSDNERLSVGALTGTSFTVTPLSPGRMVVTAVATDPEGLIAVQTFAVTVTVGNRDYDLDDDGLIDVGNLAQLDAMRYDLDGDGLADEPADWRQYHAAFVEGSWDMGCPAGCIGYELTADLDFDTDEDGDVDSGDDYWNDGDGWEPVGDAFNAFTATFDGNGNTVGNLFLEFIDSSDDFYPVGLFGRIRDGVVRGVGLLDADVTGGSYVGGLVGYSSDGEVSDSFVTGSVSGDDYVGGLVGRSGVFFYNDESHSAITGSYSTAQVSGRDNVGALVGLNTSTSDLTASFATGQVEGTGSVGGLVGRSIGPITTSYATGQVEGTGRVGGLAGHSSGPITASYATGQVEGTEDVGGLVGYNRSNITASYATGQVEGTENVGGLVGSNFGASTITASYATGLVRGDENVGGLVGAAHLLSTQTASYWDMRTSGHSIGPGGRTTTELQAPTEFGGIYQTWNLDLDGDTEADDPWDFGTSTQYPALVADFDGNGEATWQEFGYQVRAGPVLTASTSLGQGVVLTWTAADTSPWSPAPNLAYALIRDDGTTVKILASNLAGLQYTDTAVTAGASYTYQVAALVSGGAATRSALVKVIAGIANQPPLVVGELPDRALQVGTTEVVDVAGAFSDLDDSLTYAASSSDVAAATVSVSGSLVTITPIAQGRTTITVTATDTGGSNTSVTLRFQVLVWTGTGFDYDVDNDGLIEIVNWAQLDAVRHDLDGDGVPIQSGTASYASAFPVAATGMGCPTGDGCTGYELETDLDFDTNGDGWVDAGDLYWRSGSGWEPIGKVGSPLYAIFEGNGHTIRNLFSREFSAGLFGGNGGVIRRVGLIDVYLSGVAWVGGLVSQLNGGEIHSSYVTGHVAGNRWVGGLVGSTWESGRISASYSTARVTGGDRWVGGLVGHNRGTVGASYATGRVSGGDDVGGLIGLHCGSLAAGYATGTVSGGSNIGGLIGSTECSPDNATVTASYWDTVTSGLSSSAAGTGRTTSGLQEPTDYSGIYQTWDLDLDGDSVNDAPWDFGTSSQYPVLSVDTNGVGGATWQEFGQQIRIGPALMATPALDQVTLTWSAVSGVTYNLYRTSGTTVRIISENTSRRSYVDTDVTVGATYTYQVAAVINGGEASRSARVSVVVAIPDTTKPTVSKVEITSDAGSDSTYAIRDVIEVTMTFSDDVFVTGMPHLTLRVGDQDRPADYESVTDAEVLFRYRVATGDTDTNGVSIAADSLSLNGGKIKDDSDNEADLDHRALGTQSRHKVDGIQPELAATEGAVVDGSTLTLTYTETLDSTSTPPSSSFSLSGGASSRTVSNVALRGSAVDLTLSSAVAHWETGIRVGYTVPAGMGATPIQDRAGNDADRLSGAPVTNETPDRIPPTVISLEITSDPPDGRDLYGIGEEIEVTVTFSETVLVTGTPRVTLKVGERNRSANYESVTGAVVIFAYTVATNDSDTDGVNIEADSLSRGSGTIRDTARNHAVLTHTAVAADTGQQVDGIKPVLANTDGAVANGTMLTLAYSEPLDTSSAPGNDAFTVTGGSETRAVTGVRVSGNSVELTLTPAVEHWETGLRVSYTVPTGASASPIQDTAGNDADRLINKSVTNNTGDTGGPTVEMVRITSNAGSDRTYAVEDSIEVTVTFDETVVVTGTPRLTLNVGGGSRTADYLSVTGAAVKFEYRVARGDSDRDGVSIDADSLSRGGGTIRDGARNNAQLDHGAVAADSRHQVDGVPPVLATTDGAVANGTTLTLAYSEPLRSSSRPATSAFTVTGGSEARTVTRVQVSGSAVLLTLNPAVTDGESGLRLSYQPGGNPIEDVVGNAADELNNRPVTNRTGDTSGPTVETVRITSNAGSDRTYAAGETIEVTVTFSETVVVTGTPRLTLNVGGRSRTANYQDVTGAAVRFEYQVVSGDSAAYGVSIDANRLSGGTIRDGARNNAVLSHAPVAADSRHQVDGIKPTLASSPTERSCQRDDADAGLRRAFGFRFGAGDGRLHRDGRE